MSTPPPGRPAPHPGAPPPGARSSPPAPRSESASRCRRRSPRPPTSRLDASSTAPAALSVLTFAVGHGCEGSATTALAIRFPADVQAVKPTLTPGWSVAEQEAADGTTVTYTADQPLPDALRATVQVEALLPVDGRAGDVVAFPTLQTCVEGSTDWAESPGRGRRARPPGAGGHPDERRRDGRRRERRRRIRGRGRRRRDPRRGPGRPGRPVPRPRRARRGRRRRDAPHHRHAPPAAGRTPMTAVDDRADAAATAAATADAPASGGPAPASDAPASAPAPSSPARRAAGSSRCCSACTSWPGSSSARSSWSRP
ncbi:DUF1775 domain-containing protein [Clavibacter tessellarius]|uniref:DUF1775 domain-containing protein n=1 Tax=Clavibacter tessellarius TaxID=31965 RepID=UPI003254F8FF